MCYLPFFYLNKKFVYFVMAFIMEESHDVFAIRPIDPETLKAYKEFSEKIVFKASPRELDEFIKSLGNSVDTITIPYVTENKEEEEVV